LAAMERRPPPVLLSCAQIERLKCRHSIWDVDFRPSASLEAAKNRIATLTANFPSTGLVIERWNFIDSGLKLRAVALQFRNCISKFIAPAAAGYMAFFKVDADLFLGPEAVVQLQKSCGAAWRLVTAEHPDGRIVSESQFEQLRCQLEDAQRQSW